VCAESKEFGCPIKGDIYLSYDGMFGEHLVQ
jgi:hypothetical protein